MKNRKLTLVINGFMVLALLALVTLVVGCTPTSSASSEPLAEISPAEGQANIKVVGYGEAFGRPDEAQVVVGVEIFAPKVNDATSENEAIIAAILGVLEDTGIASEDIQTSNYSLWAEQRYGENGPEGIAGYRVSNQVTVLIRDIDKVGDVLAAVTAAGANSIYGVQFSVADPAALEVEAREKALVDAQERAESLAELSGLTLGSILAIDETMGQYSGPARLIGGGGGGAMDTAASISPGQLSFQSYVQVTYAIGD
jgi:uncharacterized protein YggE